MVTPEELFFTILVGFCFSIYLFANGYTWCLICKFPRQMCNPFLSRQPAVQSGFGSRCSFTPGKSVVSYKVGPPSRRLVNKPINFYFLVPQTLVTFLLIVAIQLFKLTILGLQDACHSLQPCAVHESRDPFSL